MINNKIQITSRGLENLKVELAGLQDSKRPQVVERLSRARDEGDLTENADYQAARDELEFLDGRIDELKEILDKAEVIKAKAVKVSINGDTLVYELVGEWEAKPVENKISRTSPLGLALSGAKVGEKVQVEAPAGTITYKILAIS